MRGSLMSEVSSFWALFLACWLKHGSRRALALTSESAKIVVRQNIAYAARIPAEELE